MNLLELQRQVGGAVMRPFRASVAAEAKQWVKPNDRLTANERLSIYHRQYWYRILDSFAEDFPGLCAVLGERAFTRLSHAYLAECPSESFTLRNLGSRLEQWLEDNPEFAGRHLALALDMTRLEWAHIEAFDRADRKPLGPEDLLELGPDLAIALQPHIRLLALQYPVDELRIKVAGSAEEHDRASNAVTEHRRRAVKRYKTLQPTPVFAAVHRVEFTVYYRRLDPKEFQLLQSIGSGQTIGAAIAEVDPEPEAVQQWFSNWAQLGWLCTGEGHGENTEAV